MRKISYVVTFPVVTIVLVLNILSARRPDWLVVRYEEIPYTTLTVTYGLTQLCELTLSELPSGSGKGKMYYRNYECRPFPASVTDACEKENEAFCTAWTSAGYLDQIALGFASVSLVAILFGVSTHSRRRRIWKAVVGLLTMQVVCQIATFALITDMYRTNRYPSFERARPGVAYVLHTIAWIFNTLIIFGLVLTGLSADAGHRWAAGNRAYHPIGPS